MNAMRRTGTKRVLLKRKDYEIELEREANEVQKVFEPLVDTTEESALQRVFSRGGVMPTPHHTPIESAPVAPTPAAAPDKKVSNVVTSPMVGTFFITPSPDDPPFVKIGDRIEKESVVCIIEAMKVMNEVKAGISGVVEEILVENGHPVEFGTKLFRVK